MSIESVRDLEAQPLTRPEVDELARKAGGAETLFSKRAMKHRQMGLHEQELSDDDLLRLMTEEHTFVTRAPSSSAATARLRGFRRSGWTSLSVDPSR